MPARLGPGYIMCYGIKMPFFSHFKTNIIPAHPFFIVGNLFREEAFTLLRRPENACTNNRTQGNI
jgi:hypothetical protein